MTNIRNDVPIAANDKVSDVLARDESLVDVFVRHAPHLAKLRNRAMRRVMARLVTVEQAARTANVPPSALVRELNAALGLASSADDAEPAAAPDAARAGVPRHPASASVVDVDVRDDLRSGREPFSRIMSAVRALGEQEVLHLRTIFEPAPLFAVLAKRGFVHESRAHAPDDWSVWFWRTPDAIEERAPERVSPTDAPAPNATTTVLDVRGLQPPEPLMRTLVALETLPCGHVLVQVNSRVPQFLFPVLLERGFACDVDDTEPDRVLVRIWHSQ